MKMMEILFQEVKPNAIITDPEKCKKHVLEMVENQSINCLSGKKIKCEIDSICIHGDNIRVFRNCKTN